jgi:hypothetical protein
MKNVVLLLLILAGLVSCHGNHHSKHLIPRDKFRNILTDIYMVDGYYMLNSTNWHSHNQNQNFYNSVLKEYGFTVADFDSTLKYYASRSKEFEPIMDDVITQLNKLQQETYMLQQYSDTSRNLFKQKTHWSLPKDGPREMIPFKIAIKDTGLYTIVVQLKVFHDDQSIDPHLTAYFWYNDGTKNGHIDYIPFIVYKKTDRFVVLSTSKRNHNKKVTHIKGWVLNHDNIDQNFKKHIEVKSIIVIKN